VMIFQLFLYLNIQVPSVMLPKTEPYYVWLVSSRLSSPTSIRRIISYTPSYQPSELGSPDFCYSVATLSIHLLVQKKLRFDRNCS